MNDVDWSDWSMYEASGDVEGWFPLEFRQFVQQHNLFCRNMTGWVTTRNWLFENKKETYADGFTSAVRHIAINISTSLVPRNCLVQFWRAEQVANSANDFQLTTLNQPFVIRGYSLEKPISKGICSYRMKTRDVVITGDGRGGGPISRVFMNKRMEFTPDVAYYSYEEYPQRDTALACLIKSSIIVPLSDSYGRTVGVMEFVSQSDWSSFYHLENFLSALLETYLMYLNPCKGLCGQYDLGKDSLRVAVSEIKEVIGVLCRSFDIVTAQTWMLCKHCNSLTTSERCAKELGASYHRFANTAYVNLGSYCILREGEGVVGRAAVSSHGIVYCENVAKFSIAEYPLAHFVRKNNLSASFAICLQSNLSGDQFYVLEFFLGPSYVSWGLKKKLVPILDKMRQNFRTFKAAYGGELIGDNLSAQVINAGFPDTVETLDPFQDISMDNVPVAVASASTVESELKVTTASTGQNEIKMTIQANYGSDFFRFQLSSSSGIHELHRQVFQRLKLTEGTYDLGYRDDDHDLILLRCDEDLQLYISSSIEQENYTLMVSIELLNASPL